MHYRKILMKLTLSLCFFMIFSAFLIGCGKQVGDREKDTPHTAQEAGIETKESDQCETCHLSAEMISSYEKTETEETGQSEGEGG